MGEENAKPKSLKSIELDDHSLYRLGAMRAGPCLSRNRRGKACGQKSVLGTTVCRFHGGATPQAQRLAKKRLNAYIGAFVDPDQILYELSCIAYADISLLYEANGALKPPADWPDEMRPAVASMKTRKMNLDATDGEQEWVIEIKLYDKAKALEHLAVHLQLLNKKLDVSVEVDIVKFLHAGRAHAAEQRQQPRRYAASAIAEPDASADGLDTW